ncbi:MAG: hypothetical protein Q4G08_08585 [Capnocytophaga sp.]|nr:hypothetical protein [Capnocytophaga sp.]
MPVLFLFLIIFPSCSKEEIYLDEYRLHFSNQYFEAIDSIAVENKAIPVSVEAGETFAYDDFPISRAAYNLTFYTHSNLIIKTLLDAKSHREIITIALHADGSITVE